MTVVVSGAKLRDVGDRKSWPLTGVERGRNYQSSRSVDLIGLDISTTYVEIYRSQPWIYALVNKLSRNIARLPLRSYREDAANGTKEELRRGPNAHALPVLLNRPYPRGSKFKLVDGTIGSLAIYGHAMWWKYRPKPGQPPAELWPLDWRYITIKTGDNQPIEHYEYRGPAGRKLFLPDDVVHFEWWSPAGPVGVSPLEPLRTTLALEDAGRRYAVASFANGIRPSGGLVSEKAIIGQEREELKAEIESIHMNPDNAFRMMLLDGGLDWKPFAHTAQEAETIAHRKLNREEACAVYDMPPPMVHILDHATFSNIDEQHQMLYVDTIGPWTGLVQDTIYAQLLWGEPTLAIAVDPEEGELEETSVEFDFHEITKPDTAKRAQAYVQMRQAGGWTINDVRAAEGKPNINHPAADAVLVPLNMDMIGDEGVDLQLPPRSAPAAALLSLVDALQAKATERGSTLEQVLEEMLVTV